MIELVSKKNNINLTKPIGGGKGEDGGYYIPSVDENGILSWEATKPNMPEVAEADIKGEKGQDGYTPIKGVDYFDGQNGKDGEKGEAFTYEDFTAEQLEALKGETGASGKDGYTPIKGVDYFDGEKGEKGDAFKYEDFTPEQLASLKGEKGETGAQGEKGETGASGKDGYTPVKGVDYFDGQNGKDGYTPIKGIDYFDGAKGDKGDKGADGTSITITNITESTVDSGTNTVTFSNGQKLNIKNGSKGSTGAQGVKGDTGAKGADGAQGPAGKDGYTPIKGVDYFDGAQGPKGDKGDTGPQGIQGPKGDTGATGPKGDTGAQGPTGPKGEDGKTPVKGTDYFTEEDLKDLVQKEDILTPVYYQTITKNLNDEEYEYGYLNANGTENDSYTPITVSFRTKNYLAVEGGREISFNSPYGNGTNIVISQYDANKNVVGTRGSLMTAVHKWDDEKTFTLEATTKYIRIGCYKTMNDLSTVQMNLFYVEDRAEFWDSAGNGFIYVPHYTKEYLGDYVLGSAITTPLTGKKIIYDGDSICFGAFGAGGYAKIIAEKTGGKYENFSQGGARLTHKPDEKTYHSVVDNLTNLPLDGDLYCFEGGINDFWTPKELGTFTKTDFTGALDTNTICGALETIFRYALNTFVGKPICFIITHKIQSTAYNKNANGNTFEDYRNAMVGICEKYSIPYYDAFSESGLNGWNTIQNNAFLTGNTDGTPDGCHPNEEGYKRYYVPQLISLFESVMPIV